MTQSPGSRLRQSLVDEGTGPLVIAGAPNALTARVVEEQGFEAVYVSGAGVANSFLGVPDLGLVSVSELVDHVAAVAEVVTIPVIVDADTGFGNALNVRRTVGQLERAGAAAIQLEDQVSPKKCGHFAGKAVVSTGEMVGKIRAAVDARTSSDLLIVARTDALAVLGLAEACDRAAAYREAGADLLFVEAPRSVDDMQEIIRQVPGPHLVNMVEGGLTPNPGRDALGEIGYDAILYANSAMRASVVAMRRVLAHLRDHGDTKGVDQLLLGWEDRQALVGKDQYDELDQRYAADTTLAEA